MSDKEFTLQIKRIPDHTRRQMRQAAAAKDMGIREWVLWVFEKELSSRSASTRDDATLQSVSDHSTTGVVGSNPTVPRSGNGHGRPGGLGRVGSTPPVGAGRLVETASIQSGTETSSREVGGATPPLANAGIAQTGERPRGGGDVKVVAPETLIEKRESCPHRTTPGWCKDCKAMITKVGRK